MNKDFDNVIDALNEVGLDGLKELYGIKASHNPEYENLYVLNYDQIESNKFKTHPVVKQCRSLVVEWTGDYGRWIIASQSFDRFFNEGEVEHDYNICDLTAREKVDGSLVSVFYYKGQWIYRTKSMIMPNEDAKMISGRLWKELIESTIIGPFERRDCTYIFEVVSRDNRVVTRYDGDGAYLLAVRENHTGDYLNQVDLREIYFNMSKVSSKIHMPKVFEFDTMEHVLEASKSLPNLEEGYVMYDYQNTPVLKVKSPAYVAAHRLRGEAILTEKRIIEMILIGEKDEYLAIFPEDADAFNEVIDKWDGMLDDIFEYWIDKLQYISDQKEFALTVMKECKQYQGLMFSKKKNPDVNFSDMVKSLSVKKIIELINHKD